MPGGSDSSGSNMYNISTKSNIRAAHPTNCPYYKIKLKAVQQLNCLQICDTVTTKSTYSAFSPPVQPFCFFSQPETPDSSDQILSIISNHDPVRAAACRGGTCAPFSPPNNLMVQTEISQQILQEQWCSMLGGSISQEIQHLKISQHQH